MKSYSSVKAFSSSDGDSWLHIWAGAFLSLGIDIEISIHSRDTMIDHIKLDIRLPFIRISCGHIL